MTFPRRGDIYLVEFDPARGHEIQKTRPARIVQNDIGNQHSPSISPRPQCPARQKAIL